MLFFYILSPFCLYIFQSIHLYINVFILLLLLFILFQKNYCYPLVLQATVRARQGSTPPCSDPPHPASSPDPEYWRWKEVRNTECLCCCQHSWVRNTQVRQKSGILKLDKDNSQFLILAMPMEIIRNTEGSAEYWKK